MSLAVDRRKRALSLDIGSRRFDRRTVRIPHGSSHLEMAPYPRRPSCCANAQRDQAIGCRDLLSVARNVSQRRADTVIISVSSIFGARKLRPCAPSVKSHRVSRPRATSRAPVSRVSVSLRVGCRFRFVRIARRRAARRLADLPVPVATRFTRGARETGALAPSSA